MNDFLIRHISLQGFRAYLKPRQYNLAQGNKPRSLALFAENGHGKSSLADGFEFYLSKNGTVEQLGENATTAKGGIAALRHVDAENSSIEPFVSICFKLAGTDFNEPRKVGGDTPAAVSAIQARILVDPVIRGRQLRQFVEQGETERYKQIASWFGLQPLIDLQEDLGKLKREYKRAAKDTTACDAVVSRISNITSNAVAQWNDAGVLKWINETLIGPLKGALPLSGLSKSDEGYLRLVELKAAEDARLGLPRLRQIKSAVEDVIGRRADDTATVRGDGKAATLQTAQAQLAITQRAIEDARAASAEALLSPLWAEAVKVLEQDAYVGDACPVCATPFDKTAAGTRSALASKLKTNMAALSALSKATTDEAKAQAEARTATSGLSTALTVLRTQFGAIDRPLPAELEMLAGRSSFTSEDVATILAKAAPLADALDAEIIEQEATQGIGSCKDSLEKTDKVLDMAAAWQQADAERGERQAILKAVETAAKTINDDIQEYVGGVLASLRQEVNALYKRIVRFPNRTVPPDVNLLLPDAGKKADRMCLTIDFAENCKGVAPGGYLSDAQLHSLGLALRLCAIRRFNTGAPFLVLDDVVTSYDRDHRQMVANLLASDFEDFQIVVVTHERQFFEYLRKELPQNRWTIKRIKNVEPGAGPVLMDDRPSDEEIESLLKQGQSAENEIRKAQEVWLQRICHEFGVSVMMPNPTELPKFGRGELASALESFVKDRKMNIETSYFATLKTGAAENAGSHGNLDASAGPSVGDMETRWQNFKNFRAQFTCRCGRACFQRRDDYYPKCKKDRCEEPFKGAPAEASAIA